MGIINGKVRNFFAARRETLQRFYQDYTEPFVAVFKESADYTLPHSFSVRKFPGLVSVHILSREKQQEEDRSSAWTEVVTYWNHKKSFNRIRKSQDGGNLFIYTDPTSTSYLHEHRHRDDVSWLRVVGSHANAFARFGTSIAIIVALVVTLSNFGTRLWSNPIYKIYPSSTSETFHKDFPKNLSFYLLNTGTSTTDSIRLQNVKMALVKKISNPKGGSMEVNLEDYFTLSETLPPSVQLAVNEKFPEKDITITAKAVGEFVLKISGEVEGGFFAPPRPFSKKITLNVDELQDATESQIHIIGVSEERVLITADASSFDKRGKLKPFELEFSVYNDEAGKGSLRLDKCEVTLRGKDRILILQKNLWTKEYALLPSNEQESFKWNLRHDRPGEYELHIEASAYSAKDRRRHTATKTIEVRVFPSEPTLKFRQLIRFRDKSATALYTLTIPQLPRGQTRLQGSFHLSQREDVILHIITNIYDSFGDLDEYRPPDPNESPEEIHKPTPRIVQIYKHPANAGVDSANPDSSIGWRFDDPPEYRVHYLEVGLFGTKVRDKSSWEEIARDRVQPIVSTAF